MERRYRVRDFAALAGVTVRTLHHYDRLRLLQPRGHSEGGHRLYEARDLERLEQIVALKFVGFSLGEIARLLDAKTAPRLQAALGLQRALLEAKKQRLERALAAVAAAEAAASGGRRPGTELLKTIIEVIAMENNENWTEKYYSERARQKIAARQAAFTPEMQVEVSRQWAELVAEVEAALDDNPASPRAQALAARWSKLVEGFTQRDPAVSAELGKMWADHAHWPADMQQKTTAFRPELFAFIEKAKAAAKP